MPLDEPLKRHNTIMHMKSRVLLCSIPRLAQSTGTSQSPESQPGPAQCTTQNSDSFARVASFDELMSNTATLSSQPGSVHYTSRTLSKIAPAISHQEIHVVATAVLSGAS